MDKIMQEVVKYNNFYPDRENLSRFVAENVLNTFEKQGHSGFSASYCFRFLTEMVYNPQEVEDQLDTILAKSKDAMQKIINGDIKEIYNLIRDLDIDGQLAMIKLLKGEPLTPILGTDDEWHLLDDVLYDKNNVVVRKYQNNRCSAIFKQVFKDGMEICYYLDSHIYSDNGGINYYTTGRYGREEISFPFEIPDKPKKVYLYQPSDNFTPIILTNPETIKKLYDKHREVVDSIDVE